MDALVSTSWLAAELGRPDLCVFDATLYLPDEGRDAAAEFLAGHIEGAQFFDINAIADVDTTLPHMLPSAGRFARLVAALGASNNSRVVFYDQKGLFSAARGWWMMGVFGHDRAAVLDGGLPKWRREGRPTASGQPATPAAGRFTPNLRTARVRGLGDMRETIAAQSALVLDARPAGRFTAALPEPRPGLRGGHMPGAASLPASDLLASDGTMLPVQALRARFAQAGADGHRPVVTSCGSGVTAAILTLGLTVAGLPPGALYDGAWSEWGGQDDTPVVTGGGS
jgi:thiosulfate/3-mercaptopyruvate sulfurtransferase